MAQKNPAVSILMPFYDDGRERTRKYLLEAIGGALSQSFRDFELLLVVAGEKGFARKAAKKSGKIRVFYSGRQGGYDSGLKAKIRGLAQARNLGVEHARGRLIAFFDADDVSLPSRLKAQLGFLGKNPQIGAVGSSMLMINGQGEEIGIRRSYESDAEIRRGFLQFNTMPQPTVMARKSLIVRAGGYSEQEIAEDFDLWVRMAKITRFHNLPAALVKYRVHAASGATRVRLQLYLGSLKVKLRASSGLGITPGIKDLFVNLMQLFSLFFPESLRRTALERIRSKVVVGK